MHLLPAFRNFIASRKLFFPKARLLLAVSGGLDSVVLAHLCREAGFIFSIAHVNFKLRGEESEGDEAFVHQLAELWGVPFFVHHVDAGKFAEEKNISIQVAARELRYAFFHELIERKQADHILTAHHADDNAETILMNFFRGTGIEGLRGIPPINGKVVRPLLFATREQIEVYAKQHQLAWRNDSSNLSDKYTRNQIRHHLIPAVEAIFPGFRNTLYGNATRFAELEIIYQKAIKRVLKKMVRREGETEIISIGAVNACQYPHSLIYEWLQPFGFTSGACEEVLKLTSSEAGKFVSGGDYFVLRHRNNLVLSAQQPVDFGYIVWEDLNVPLKIPGGEIIAKEIDDPAISPNPNEAWLDARHFQPPVIVRRWKKGDYFYPLGMRKKKKLSDFFTDAKLSVPQKEKVWIIESGSRIAWVVGMRIDDRFKITPGTKKAIRLRLMTE